MLFVARLFFQSRHRRFDEGQINPYRRTLNLRRLHVNARRAGTPLPSVFEIRYALFL